MINSLFSQVLRRSHDTFARAMQLFDRPVIGDEVWAELEEVLISADVGVGTTEKLIARVKQGTKRGADGASVRAALQAEMINILKLPPAEVAVDPSPKVTLVVGVNGSGKTTSIAKLDGTARGGIVLAIGDELKIPIQFVGTGEKIEDLSPFDAEAFVEALCS